MKRGPVPHTVMSRLNAKFRAWRFGKGTIPLKKMDCPPCGSPIFITARFRTGSTLLWNMFRQTSGITAFYEPLHSILREPVHRRGAAFDPTHEGVEKHFAEYEQIRDLSARITDPWDCKDLYFDAADRKPSLASYIDVLIQTAPHRPVLQFNRVDFRLAWLQRTFPDARIIHLFRHPRDQWLSALRNPADFGPHDPIDKFAHCDYFFLNNWVEDLSSHFPVLDWKFVDHPYQMFYMVWKLSYMWGKAYSDLSISYEQMLTCPDETTRHLFNFLGIDLHLAANAAQLIKPKAIGKWRTYADAAWFDTHEHAAEAMLDTLPCQVYPRPSACLDSETLAPVFDSGLVKESGQFDKGYVSNSR